MQAHLTPHPSITIYFKATSKELLFWERCPNAYLGKLSSFQVEPTFLNPSSTLVSPIPVVCIQSQVSHSSPMKSILRCSRTPTHTHVGGGWQVNSDSSVFTRETGERSPLLHTFTVLFPLYTNPSGRILVLESRSGKKRNRRSSDFGSFAFYKQSGRGGAILKKGRWGVYSTSSLAPCRPPGTAIINCTPSHDYQLCVLAPTIINCAAWSIVYCTVLFTTINRTYYSPQLQSVPIIDFPKNFYLWLNKNNCTVYTESSTVLLPVTSHNYTKIVQQYSAQWGIINCTTHGKCTWKPILSFLSALHNKFGGLCFPLLYLEILKPREITHGKFWEYRVTKCYWNQITLHDICTVWNMHYSALYSDKFMENTWCPARAARAAGPVRGFTISAFPFQASLT